LQNDTQCIQEDTIDLRELFAVLKKRKKLIWSVTGTLTIFAIVYAFFIAKPIYEAKGIVELAQINKESVQDTNDLKQKLEFIHVNTKGKKKELPVIKNISLPKKSSNLMVIIAVGHDNDSAQKKLEEFITELSTIQNKELAIYVTTQKERLQLIKEDMERNQKQSKQIIDDISDYKEKLLSISREDAALAGIYSIEIGKKQTELNNITNKTYSLKNKKNDIELSISPLKIQETIMVGKIELLDKPVKPKKKLIVIITFITGLMLSVFLVFILEFISGMKKEEEKKE